MHLNIFDSCTCVQRRLILRASWSLASSGMKHTMRAVKKGPTCGVLVLCAPGIETSGRNKAQLGEGGGKQVVLGNIE